MEYYIQTSLGLVTITPREGLPSAVELRVAGIRWATYLSAEHAAIAVSSSSTGHEQLDALSSWSVPVLLSDWSQSVPHHFNTGASQAELPDDLVMEDCSITHPDLEMDLAF